MKLLPGVFRDVDYDVYFFFLSIRDQMNTEQSRDFHPLRASAPLSL